MKRRDRTYGIAVDEDGEHRNIRRMSHGRHVVNGRLKPGSNSGTKAPRYVRNNIMNGMYGTCADKTDFHSAFFGVLLMH